MFARSFSSRPPAPAFLRTVSALLLGSLLFASMPAVFAQVGGRGPDPIPAFNQDVGGGGADANVNFPSVGPTVTFDPTPSYLPAPATPDQTYLYTLTWDFGDGTAPLVVGPAAAANVLVPQKHTYPAPVGGNTADFVVNLQIDVTVVTGVVQSAGPSSFVQGTVRTAGVNYPPDLSLVMLSSPPVSVPYQLLVDPAATRDSDGFIIWAAIDWGDGSFELLKTLPPSKVAIPSSHIYTAPGTYSVILSVVDNGRMPPGTILNPVPPPGDPVGALVAIQQNQQRLLDLPASDPNQLNPVYNLPKYLPILRQDFLQVTIPGNLEVTKGGFTLNFQDVGKDAFNVTFILNIPVASVANARVTVQLGTTASQILPTFTTDLKGNYINSAQGLSFKVNPRTHLLQFSVKSAPLQAALKIFSGTTVNGFQDVPVVFTIAGPTGPPTVLGTRLRFVYNSQQGRKGVGKNPHSIFGSQ